MALTGLIHVSRKFSKSSISRAMVKLGGQGGVEVETSMLKEFGGLSSSSSSSSRSSAVVAGFGGSISLAGASIKLKFQRSGAKFIVPVQLYGRPSIRAALGVFVFPPAIYWSLMR